MGAKKVDFDTDPIARRNLKQILDEECRNLYPYEVAYLLSICLTEVYDSVPRVIGTNTSVRFDPAVIKRLKSGSNVENVGSSLKIEKKTKNIGLPETQNMRKGKADICL